MRRKLFGRDPDAEQYKHNGDLQAMVSQVRARVEGDTLVKRLDQAACLLTAWSQLHAQTWGIKVNV